MGGGAWYTVSLLNIGQELHTEGSILQIKMRSFYVHFAFRAYATNVQLQHMGKIDTDQCSFCKNARETRVHLFWECSKVQPLWQELITFCKKYVDAQADYCRNNCLLFGFGTLVLNLIVTLCKHHIHCARIFQFLLSVQAILHKLRYARNNELLAAKMLTNVFMSKTRKYWGELMKDDPFIGIPNSQTM